MISQIRVWHGVVLAFIAAILLPTLVQRVGRDDLKIVNVAAERLWAGEPVYRLEDPNEHTKPPPATFLFLPLTAIPFFWLCRLWDVANLLCAFFFIRALAQREASAELSALSLGCLAAFLFLTPLNSELRLGQYNLLLFSGLAWGGLARRSYSTGALLCLGVLFKPTLVLMLPWVFCRAKRPFSLLLMAAFTGVVVCVGYLVTFGITAFTTDLRTWVEFLPLSSAKHLLRPDNHGLPSWLAFTFGGSFEKTLLVSGFVLSGVAALRCPDPLLSLSMVSFLMVVCSPMAWLQNYALLLPAGIWVLARSARAGRGEHAALGLAVFVLWLGIGALNPTTCAWSDCERWPVQRLPLGALLTAAAIVAGVTRFGADRGPRGDARRSTPRRPSRRPPRARQSG